MKSILNKFSTFNLIILAILISIILQSVFLLAIYDDANVYFNGHFVPLWTHDAGLYGYYAKKILSGHNYPFISTYTPSWLLYFVVKNTPFSLEQCMFYLPVLISSLIVIPIVLMFKMINQIKLGVFAGILSTLTLAYYYRSFFGYYDTDILNIFFPLMVILSLMKLEQNKAYLLIGGFSMLGFSLWYHSYLSIAVSIIGMFAFYTLLFKRDESKNYLAMAVLCVPFFHFALWIKALSIVIIFIISFFLKNSKFYPLSFLIVLPVMIVQKHTILSRFNNYLNKTDEIKYNGLSLLNQLGLVAETQGISLNSLGELLSIHISLAFLGIFGFVYLCFVEKRFIIFTPLALLSLASLYIGERFAFYGVVPVSIGLCYFMYILSQYLPRYKNKALYASLCVLLVLYTNHAFNFAKTETPVLNKSDLEVLSKVPKKGRRVALSWWDYGYPLMYELNAIVVTDNGSSTKRGNFLIAKLLFDQNQSFISNASKQISNIKLKTWAVESHFLKNFSLKDAFKRLSKPTKAKLPTYWFLNTDLLSIAPTIKSYAEFNPKTGKKENHGFLVYIKKSNQIKFDKQRGTLMLNGNKFQISSYTNTKTKEFRAYKGINLHFVQTPTHYLVCTANIYNSFLVQALLFKKIDKNAFDIIAQNDNAVVLKAK